MEPIDIWRSAQLIVKLHGAESPAECKRRVKAMRARGDLDDEAVWLAIEKAAASLLRDGPPEDI